MLGRLFDKTLFAFFGIVYYLHVGRSQDSGNLLNIEGFLFMWCDHGPGCGHARDYEGLLHVLQVLLCGFCVCHVGICAGLGV